MHDLAVMYARVLDILRASSEDYFDADGNTQTYPRPPKPSDLEVVALAATAECLECGSENLLWAKFHEYPALLPHRGTRQRYNARRRRLRPEIDRANARIADWLDDGRGGDALVIDSMPIETVRVTRARPSPARADAPSSTPSAPTKPITPRRSVGSSGTSSTQSSRPQAFTSSTSCVPPPTTTSRSSRNSSASPGTAPSTRAS